METTANRNTAILMQLSALTQYIFPLGNFIFPVLIWSSRKEDSAFVDYNGKQVINFQLSLLLYSLVLIILTACILVYTVLSNFDITAPVHYDYDMDEFSLKNITGITLVALIAVFLLAILKMAEFFLIIYASVKNSNGENYKFPLTINFIK